MRLKVKKESLAIILQLRDEMPNMDNPLVPVMVSQILVLQHLLHYFSVVAIFLSSHLCCSLRQHLLQPTFPSTTRSCQYSVPGSEPIHRRNPSP